MTRGQKIAKRFLDLGLNPVPVKSGTKEPARMKHNTYFDNSELTNFSFDDIGISTGIVSGGLEVLDFDLKNAEDPDYVIREFESRLDPKLLSKLVVQRTKSGGYHYIYRCSEITSSKKLAKNDTGEAVIETRGEGGYIKCYPSEGYEMKEGSPDFSKIPLIEPFQRNQLWVSAKMLNKQMLKDSSRRVSKEDRHYFKKFPDYNTDTEVATELLIKHGWTIHSHREEWINFTRPNKNISDGISAGYNTDGNFLFVFSTSQDVFETEKPYNNHAIFAELECEGRYDTAYAKLFEQGYGIPDEEVEEDYEDPVSFLSDEIEENDYLEQVRKGEIEEGLSTGWEEMDNFYRFKPNTVNVGLGFDNVGKSVFINSLMVASKVMHGWKWGIAAPENKTAVTRRRLIETESGKPASWFAESPHLFEIYKKESRESFKIIANRNHYSIEEVLNLGKILYERYAIDAFLIDPYNFFRVDGNGYSMDNDILSKIRVFAEKYCAVFIMAHTYTGTTRNNFDEFGYLKAPTKYDIQGGNNFANRVDDFFVIHRLVNHTDKEIRRTLQFSVEKVKETETGGQRHSKGEFTPLVWEERDGFLGYWDEKGNNPMYRVLKNKRKILDSAGIKPVSPSEAFETPF